ncbi:hypothetical protein [Caldimonas brevitalea]|uniref:Ornithine carbamoyltransferase n=1 Tax=Caldimonas brevitalea TaxID=413882 RepID=A0A0G3BJD5_9BURK|nr:hypothetical protein [Caldimonas brevitalea]AKJ29487.1 ornithine carbamoyltransferase [Caldimonas brevitalea]
MPYSNPVLPHRKLWSVESLAPDDVLQLLETARRLKQAARAGRPSVPLRGRNLALWSADPAGSRGDVVHDAALELGAQVARLHPGHAAMSSHDEVHHTAQMLGRLYDALDCEGLPSEMVRLVDRGAGVPVYNGLGSDEHPVRVLAELMGLQERTGKPLGQLRVALVGDPRRPCADALLQIAAMTGLDVRFVAPRAQWPEPVRLEQAQRLAGARGLRLQLIESLQQASDEADIVVDATDPLRWRTEAPAAGADEREHADNRRYTLQALLLCTLS